MGKSATSEWSRKYGAKHEMHRVESFPDGVTPPEKVRLYRRTDHYVLQWWDPRARKNLSDRVDGDLVTAIGRAREIDERLQTVRSAGTGRRRLQHDDLVTAYETHLEHRADAGEITPGTVDRYRSALKHYRGFVELPETSRRYSHATNIDRDFALSFAAHLANTKVTPNGHPNARSGRMTAPGYVEDVVRGMLAWAADPEEGNLLPTAFRNPFRGRRRKTDHGFVDPFADPDITMPMAVDFLQACDDHQLPLFGLITLYGLRPSESCYLFHEALEEDWLVVGCDPQLGYWTKGRRDKRLPLIEPLSSVLPGGGAEGVLFVRRAVVDRREQAPLRGVGLEELRNEFHRRCGAETALDVRGRCRIRDELIRQSGGLDYDRVQHEFRRVARTLDWSGEATLKDFRHLFATELQNAGVPDHYRKYLMGHSAGRGALLSYSHLNEVRTQYERAVDTRYGPVLDVLKTRLPRA